MGLWTAWKSGSLCTLRPPQFDLSLIDVDITLHYTIADNVVGEGDILEMERVLPNAVARKVASDTFSHVGFIFNTDVKELVTDYMLAKLKTAENM